MNHNFSATDLFDLCQDGILKDVTDLAFWSSSSAKKDKDLKNAFDNSTDTFWQSEGPQPHNLIAEFCELTSLSAIAIYLDFKTDESYTPKK